MRLELHGLPQRLEEAIRSVFAVRGGESDSGPDVAIVSAGTPPLGGFLDIAPAQWSATVDGLADACFAAQHLAEAALAEGRPARLIFVSHPAAVRPIGGATLAALAGAFLTTIAEVAAVELGSRDITANTLVPGWTDDAAPPVVLDAIPAGRFVEPDELAHVCAFLASPAATYISGATIVVDGAFTVTKSPGGSPFLAHSRPTDD